MKPGPLQSQYLQLPPREKVAFLSRLARDVTVFARGTYTVGTDGVAAPARLRTCNEMLNRILSQQADLLARTSDQYPDDVFFGILLELAAELKIERVVVRALGTPTTMRRAAPSKQPA